MMYMEEAFAAMDDAPPLDENGIAHSGDPLTPGTQPASREDVVAAMQTVYDPEIPVNIYELGLIYSYDIEITGDVHVFMTLTAPGCPVAGVLPGHLARTVAAIDGVGVTSVELAWDPPWEPSMMSEAARVELNMF
jgi:FeS assembly SUF system protein